MMMLTKVRFRLT